MHSNRRSPTLSQIRARLRVAGGKDPDQLLELAARIPAEAQEVSRLLGLLPSREDAVELGVTWLVKNLLERSSSALPAQRTRRLVRRLLDCRLDWSRLHLLQSLPHTNLGPSTRRDLEPVLGQWLDQIHHGFTRAWVYDALVRCADRRPSTTTALLERFAGAYDQERPAVRARLRRLIVELEER